MLTRIFCLLGSALYLTSSSLAGEMPDAMMRDAPSLSGYSYRCESTVKLVNYLRGLGKEKALTILRDYVRRDPGVDHGERVVLLCRLLFVNPKGWSPPALGGESPAVRDGSERRFPLFPFAVTKGVPFYLLEGYNLAGLPEPPEACLDACEKFSLVPDDMALTGYKEAALALVGSTDFQELYRDKNPEDLREMREIILRQAGVRQ